MTASAGFSLRTLELADVPAVAALELILFPVDAWPVQMFYDEVSQPATRRYLTAEVNGVLVGYAGLMCIDTTADIQTIGVLPEYQARGIGRAMFEELLSEARRRGAHDVLLEVRSDNPRAQRMYKRFGFEHIHTRRGYYRDGADALVMRLRQGAEGSAEMNIAGSTDGSGADR